MAPSLDTTVSDDRAHSLRADYHAYFKDQAELPVPVESIAEDLLGLRVAEEPLEVSGLLVPAERLIVLNKSESLVRRRFTLAHEVGHWVCQHLEGTAAPVYCRVQDVAGDTDRALEREANIFAAELLMPPGVVRALYQGSAEEVSERLGVSGLALGWRLYSLGLVTEKPA